MNGSVIACAGPARPTRRRPSSEQRGGFERKLAHAKGIGQVGKLPALPWPAELRGEHGPQLLHEERYAGSGALSAHRLEPRKLRRT